MKKQIKNPFQGGLFDGRTYDSALDGKRLKGQGLRVYTVLLQAGYDRWLTLRGIADRTGDPEASVSARLRDLRKERFGGNTVEARRMGGGHGTWEYRLRTERRV